MDSRQRFSQAELRRRLFNLVRQGVIESVDHASARAVVRFNEELASPPLPWAVERAHEEIVWDAPAEGEQVLVFSPGGELAQGVILGRLYQQKYPAPSDAPKTGLRQHSDGAKEGYDAETSVKEFDLPVGATLHIKIGETTVTVRDGEAVIDAETILLGSDGDRKEVARKGDKVMINGGSSAGLNGVIHEGSGRVKAS